MHLIAGVGKKVIRINTTIFVTLPKITIRCMHIDATAVANYFIKLSIDNNKPIDLLGLLKRVYIAHGFSLALYDKSLLNERFDKVEAWRYGPVIPSLYHTFKHYGRKSISKLAEIAQWSDEEQNLVFTTPKLDDAEAKKVCDMVWKRYEGYSGSELVSLTHRDGTPWSVCYVEGENCAIPDQYTKIYYQALVDKILNG